MNPHSSQKVARISAMVALFAVGAHLRIPTPLVPLTLQSAVVLMAGLILGKHLGALSATMYLLVGLTGFPVFATGGGPGYVFKPTFGYIIGFIPAAWIAGMAIREGKSPKFRRLLPYLFCSLLSIYLIGIPYLIFAMDHFVGRPINFKTAFLIGFLFPLPGDILTGIIVSMVSLRIRRILMPEE